MSPLGQKQTLSCVCPMSALPPKADIDRGATQLVLTGPAAQLRPPTARGRSHNWHCPHLYSLCNVRALPAAHCTAGFRLKRRLSPPKSADVAVLLLPWPALLPTLPTTLQLG